MQNDKSFAQEDGAQTRQLFRNLLRNLALFSPAEGADTQDPQQRWATSNYFEQKHYYSSSFIVLLFLLWSSTFARNICLHKFYQNLLKSFRANIS